ncbi:MAG: FRG domain-containing protein, partial [Planctomycetaceae bacterium]|nr:FRG domain-containing protein [Planctomycetaceae bacterium]
MRQRDIKTTKQEWAFNSPMITPLNHYKEHDRVITRFSDAQRLIDEIKEYANSRNLSVYWRGQVDYRWGLHSSLARQLSSVTMLNDALIDKVENAILKEAAKWIDDFKYKPYRQPLARLAYLQHHGIPTRLIDFTHNPAVALFFATESLDEVDGRIFALLVRNKEVLKKTPRGTPWRDYGSNEVKIWDPVATAIIFSRLEAQEGVFAIGRLPSTRPYRTGWDELLE